MPIFKLLRLWILSALSILSCFANATTAIPTLTGIQAVNPTAATTLLGLHCTGCSSNAPKTFALFLKFSNTSCASFQQTLQFLSTPIDTSSTLYLISSNLPKYLSKLSQPVTGLNCIQLYCSGPGSSVIAIISNNSGAYLRTFPAPPTSASVLQVS